MYDKVVHNTTIGESGKFLEDLKTHSKFLELKKKLPLATLVVTTSKPDDNKKVSCKTLVNLSIRGERLAFLVGLGRKGLPASLRKKATYHWDVTDKSIPLETCTAIGYIAARFTTMLEMTL